MAHIKRYLPSILHNFLADKRQTTLDFSTNRPASFNRVDAVHSYFILSDSTSTKVLRIFQAVDKYISYNQKELLVAKQIESGRNESLGLMVSRLMMLIKYNSQNTQLIRSLLEYVLIADRLYHSEVILFLRLLSSNMGIEGQTNKKLIGNVRDGIQEYLEKNNIVNYPYKYISLLTKISVLTRSFLFSRLTCNLYNDFDRIIQRADPYLLHQTLAVNCRKSNKLLMRLGLRENSLFKKRLIYEMIASRMDIDCSRYELPGKLCKSQQQVVQKSNFMRALSQSEQLFSYSTRIQEQDENKNRVVEFKMFVDNLFCLIESGNGILEKTQLNQIVNRLNHIIQNDVNKLQMLIDKNSKYLVKFILIISYLRANLNYNQEIAIISKNWAQYLTSKNINVIQICNQLRQSPIFIPFLLLQCFSHIIAHKNQYQPSQHLSLQCTGEIIKQLNKSADRKKYTILKEVYGYTNLWLKLQSTPQSYKLTQLLSSQQFDKNLIRLVEQNQQKNQKASLKVMNLMSRVNEKWQFVKNVYIQPNIHLTYCFVDRRSKLPLVCFESAQNSQRYVVRNRSFGDKQIDQRSDLNLYGIWKRQFLKEIHSCEFYCCNDESQLAQKIFTFILKNGAALQTTS